MIKVKHSLLILVSHHLCDDSCSANGGIQRIDRQTKVVCDDLGHQHDHWLCVVIRMVISFLWSSA